MTPILPDALRDKLRHLRLNRLASQWEDDLKEAARQGMSHATFLSHVVEVRIPTKADTHSDPYRTAVPIHIGQGSERSDAVCGVIEKCPTWVNVLPRISASSEPPRGDVVLGTA